MGVYIPKMEKPTDCDYCDFYRWGYCHVMHARVECEDGVDDDCPLISVAEPHGRLVDIDAVYNDICDSIDAMTRIGLMVDGECLGGKLNDAIDNAPTVIEAEGE